NERCRFPSSEPCYWSSLVGCGTCNTAPHQTPEGQTWRSEREPEVGSNSKRAVSWGATEVHVHVRTPDSGCVNTRVFSGRRWIQKNSAAAQRLRGAQTVTSIE